MASIGGHYLNPHRSQYDATSSASTRATGCTPTTGANGANASTGGRVNKSAEAVHDLIPRSQETDPGTPGWSIEDLDHAMAKLGVGFERGSGGWAGVVAALESWHYVAIQGDSDQFSNATCSGAFDGNHCVGIHPAFRVVDGLRQRWIDDPICKTGRWEYEWRLHRYASKFNAGILWGLFTAPVPKVATTAPVVTLRFGARKLTPRQTKRIRVPAGRRARVRARPTTAAKVVATLANGQTFTAYQVTTKGQQLAGSSRWYGNRTGTRWLHVTAF